MAFIYSCTQIMLVNIPHLRELKKKKSSKTLKLSKMAHLHTHSFRFL